MGWIACRGGDLVIGDAVRLNRRVKRKGKGGAYIRGQVRKPMKAGGWEWVEGHERHDFVYDGRVVDIDRMSNGKVFVCIDRVMDVGTVELGTMIPSWRDWLPTEMLDWRSTRLHRNTAHGVEDRFGPTGRTYLLQRLREAAGGDDTCPEAVERVARCVHPEVIEAAAKHRGKSKGAPLLDLGVMEAKRLLSGESMHVAAIVFQLKNPEKIPVAEQRVDEEKEWDRFFDQITGPEIQRAYP